MGVRGGWTALAAVAAVAALTGCGGDGGGIDDTRTPSAASETPTRPPANVRYDSVFDLRERVEAAGVPCPGWDVLASPTNAVERAHCTDTLTLATHTDASQAAASVEAIAEVIVGVLEDTSAHVVGPNWTVNCGQAVDTCEQLRDALGGEVEVHEP